MSHAPRTIALVGASLGPGGAERVLAQLANAWARRGVNVALVTISNMRGDFYRLDSAVRRYGLDLLHPSSGPLAAVTSNARRANALRRVLRDIDADVVLSFLDQTNVLTVAATRGSRARVIVSERDNPFRSDLGRPWQVLRRVAYPRADAVVAQTEAVARWVRTFVKSESVRVIPNPVADPRATSDVHAHRIAALGRLEAKKGFDLLIRGFARTVGIHAGWELAIGGEGPERRALEMLARDLGVGDRVRLVGRVEDSVRFMSAASIFVLSSRYEGFPNVLLEAMATGLACVACNCDFGPSDIIRDGVDGILVPSEDHSAIATALLSLMSNEDERARLGAAATDVTRRFAAERIFAAWDEVAFGTEGSCATELRAEAR
jgi:GalNAc-alpha-(1->4)-GalNAc-alpha-(1->3)-diNAcBac-PP-undecaprenol alpha-1,4-N-acetyl-D-galactosaminyltransferase